MNKKNDSGLKFLEIMIIVALVGLFAAIAIPNFAKARDASHRLECQKNLNNLNNAAHYYVRVHSNMPTLQNLEQFIGHDLVCRSGGKYIGPGKDRPGGSWICSLITSHGHTNDLR